MQGKVTDHYGRPFEHKLRFQPSASFREGHNRHGESPQGNLVTRQTSGGWWLEASRLIHKLDLCPLAIGDRNLERPVSLVDQ